MFVYLRFSAGQTDIPMSGKSFVFESYNDLFPHILVVELSRFLILQFELDALDVNAVGFIDETSNIIYSGSDNGIIKVRKKIILCMIYTQQRPVKHGTELSFGRKMEASTPSTYIFSGKIASRNRNQTL